jgi:Repeat of unknown function (DUF5907)
MLLLPAVLVLMALGFGMDFPALAADGPVFGRPAPVPSPVSMAQGLGWVFPRYRIYRAAGGSSFSLVPERLAADPGAAQQARPSSMDQVTLGAFDPVNNALRINATLTPGGSHTPANADQVFTSIFDPVNNAVRVNCVVGCGGGSLTLAGDLGGSATTQTVIGLEGRPLSAATPAANQVLTWNGSAWAPANAAAAGVQLAQDLGGSAVAPKVVGLQGSPVSSALPSSPSQFLGWSGTQWTPVQPSFSNISGVATQSQLPAFSGIGACPANQFASTLNQGAAPTCAQPSFSSLSGTVTPGQLPAASGTAQGALVLAKDLGGTAASPQVVGLQGSPVAPTPPSNNQVLTWTGTAWTPQASASGGAQIAQDLGGTLSAPKVVGLQGYAVSATGPSSSNQFLGWNSGASTWTPTQPSFANLGGAVSDTQLASPYSGVGVCPANQFVVTLVRNAPPLCAAAVTASPGYPNQFATGISASGTITYAQPSFSNLSGVATKAQAPAATVYTDQPNVFASGNKQTFSGSSAAAGLNLAPLNNDPSSLVPGDLWMVGSQLKWRDNGTTALTRTVLDTSRNISTAGALTGGGSLATDLTLSVSNATTSAPGVVQLTGDLAGTATAPAVAKIQGNPVSSQPPAANQVLTWVSGAWTPQTPASVQIGGDLGGALSAPQVVSTHLGAPLPLAQGGTGLTAAGLSGQCLTSNGTAAVWGSCGTFAAGGDLTGGATSQIVAKLQGNTLTLAAPSSNQFIGWNGSAFVNQQPSFSNLGGSIAASQMPLSSEGDLLYSHTGALARLGVGLSGTCLTSNGADPAWGPCAGAGAIFSSPSSQQTITPISDLTPLVLTAKSGGQLSDIFDVCDVPTCATKYLGVGTGGITSSFSQWTAGQVGQATPGSFAALSGSGPTVSTGYFSVQLNDHTVLGNFTADPTQPGQHIPCFTSGTPSGACPAGTQLVLNPMLGPGDLMVGSAGGTPVRLAANSTGTSCLTETSAGVASWGPCGGGSAAWSSLTAPAANLLLSMGSNQTALTYGNATGAGTNLFNITDTANNTGTGYLATDEVQSGSAALPLLVGSEAATGTFTAPAAPGAGYAGIDLFQLGAATSSANYNSPFLRLCGQYFSTGTTADCWTLQESLGTGGSPTSALALVHSGSAGALSVSFPSAGTSLKNVSNVASAAGNLQLQAAAASYVAFQGSTGLNKTLADPNGTVLANGAGYAVRNAGNSQYYTIQLKATSAVSAGNLVCVDSANADQIVSCATGASSGIVGFAPVAIAAAATGDVVLQGVVTNAVLDGTCAIGNWVIPSGTTSGHVSCTSTFTGGKVAGIAMSKTGLHVLASRE